MHNPLDPPLSLRGSYSPSPIPPSPSSTSWTSAVLVDHAMVVSKSALHQVHVFARDGRLPRTASIPASAPPFATAAAAAAGLAHGFGILLSFSQFCIARFLPEQFLPEAGFHQSASVSPEPCWVDAVKGVDALPDLQHDPTYAQFRPTPDERGRPTKCSTT